MDWECVLGYEYALMVTSEDIKEFRPGVLNDTQIWDLIQAGILSGSPLEKNDIGYSSIDLHLCDQIWVMKGGIKGNKNSPYSEILADNKYYDSDANLDNGIKLKSGKTYVAKLKEKVRIRDALRIFGYASGKSTIGRLDVLTRLIADYSDFYEQLPYPKDCQDKTINLYVEITPITFKIKVKTGDSLNQLRFFSGSPDLSLISPEESLFYGGLLVDKEGKLYEAPEYLSVDITLDKISDSETASAFKAVKNNKDLPTLDVSSDKGSIDPKTYWEIIKLDQDSNTLEIKKDQFYIIRSKERLSLPNDVAVYAQAMTENLGELRIHYAGFAHPLFGIEKKKNGDPKGTPLIFEIRGHNVSTFLRDGERVAKLIYSKMSRPFTPKVYETDNLKKLIDAKKNDIYSNQGLQLSKIFKPWKD